MSFTYSPILWKQIVKSFEEDKTPEKMRMVFVSKKELFFMTKTRSYKITDLTVEEETEDFTLYKVMDKWPFGSTPHSSLKVYEENENLVITDGTTQWSCSSNVAQQWVQRALPRYKVAYVGFQPSLEPNQIFHRYNWARSDVMLPAFHFIESIGNQIMTSKNHRHYPIAFYSPASRGLSRKFFLRDDEYGFYVRSQMRNTVNNIGIEIKFNLKLAEYVEKEIERAILDDVSPPKLERGGSV